MDDTVSVTQADRNDAADYGKAMQTLSGRERDSILRGKWDSSAPVQWFARRRLASTQPAPAFPREEVAEADLFQAIHDAMADECNGAPDGDIIVKGCEAAGYCDPESAADAFKAAAVQAIAALLQGKQP